jgi:hypothetical protein
LRLLSDLLERWLTCWPPSLLLVPLPLPLSLPVPLTLPLPVPVSFSLTSHLREFGRRFRPQFDDEKTFSDLVSCPGFAT